jgi:phenylacetate 2-hydroxylase
MGSSTSLLIQCILARLEGHHALVFFLIASVVVVAIKLANQTDIPKIKGLPELPGVPMFGSLFLLGKHHARNCARLSKAYGEVFQARLGNRVRHSLSEHFAP